MAENRDLIYLHAEKGDRSQQINGGFQILHSFDTRRRKIILSKEFPFGRFEGIVFTHSVHRQIDADGIVQLIEQFDEFVFLNVVER